MGFVIFLFLLWALQFVPMYYMLSVEQLNRSPLGFASLLIQTGAIVYSALLFIFLWTMTV